VRTAIKTHTGRYVGLLKPHPDVVDMRDVVYSLEHLNRYTGHVGHYTVADHSAIIADELRRRGEPDEVVIWGALHDGGEAYVGDWSRPLKDALAKMPSTVQDGGATLWDHGYRAAISDVLFIEKAWNAAVLRKAGLTGTAPPIVKQLDDEIGAWERYRFMGSERPETPDWPRFDRRPSLRTILEGFGLL